ncbi:hypothetical protein, partial [Nocardioides malaquae]|uniref:hypothetical protein n=1 Tax=Nocardioides malaquae TaxID=2773426 RepID=UPI001D0D4D2D
DGQLDTSDCFTSAPKRDNDDDTNGEEGSVSHNDDKIEDEEGDISGLINSDGEEENWKPVIIGKWQQIPSDYDNANDHQ